MKTNPRLIGFAIGVIAGLSLSFLGQTLGIGMPFAAYVFASVRYPYTRYVLVRFINVDAFVLWCPQYATYIALLLNLIVWTAAFLYVFGTEKIRRLLGW